MTHQEEMYKQTNQASIDFSIKTIWSLFLINGAAATALFSTGEKYFYYPALIFAVGAIAAVITFGLSYFYSLLLSETWRPEYEISSSSEKFLPIKFFGFGPTLSLNTIGNLRFVPIIFAIVSIALFAYGVFKCYSLLCLTL